MDKLLQKLLESTNKLKRNYGYIMPDSEYKEVKGLFAENGYIFYEGEGGYEMEPVPEPDTDTTGGLDADL